jgi:hypothetical protein
VSVVPAGLRYDDTMNRKVECPDCRVAMEEGFFADRGDHSRVAPASWIAGAPEKSFWSGTKTRGKEQHEVAVLRCPRCGLLRLYAPEAGS